VGDEHGVPGEVEEATHGGGRARGGDEIAVGDPGQRGNERRQRHARVDERLERACGCEGVDADRADLTDARLTGTEPGRL
jgi:hypothetical protein